MKNQTMKNSLQKFLDERSAAYDAWDNLNLGQNDDLKNMTTKDILEMVAELEDAQAAGKINLETEAGLAQLKEIITRYERDDRTPVYYDNECIGKVLTNRSHTIWELLDLLRIDHQEVDSNGEPIWDLELFSQEIVARGKSSGRPPLYEDTMKLVSIYLTADMITWLKAQPDGVSATIRNLIEKEIVK